MMPLNEDLDFVTARISEQVRLVALACLAFAWLFLSRPKELPAVQPNELAMLGVAALALVVLLLDYGQYLAAYRLCLASRADVEAGEATPDEPYDSGSRWYRFRGFAFSAKQWTAGACAVLLVGAVAFALPTYRLPF